ncbi:ubiquitin-like protein Pup [Kribbia dieselivorans]|uniref:ubiquitin-like protein Pup n=1 Tax=Kribbia dieselivorans TaxID=331526 RepID=UPI00083960F7|nr:ubiquitin-like protein Pup [Kribbia dieselivorans]
MSEQVHGHGGRDDNDEIDDAGQVQASTTDDSLDDVLDEIDNVLESNAEEFVAGFVQKGGQ